jgi:cobalt-zinc-cadmium efflux system outer membrane protein
MKIETGKTRFAAGDRPGLQPAAGALAILLAATGLCGAQPPTGEEAAAVPDPLTPESALAFAWDNHPRMKEAQALVKATYGSRVQAGLWPRPELGVAHLAKVDVDIKSEDSLALSQKFELGGKRDARIAMADAETFVRQAELLDRWLEVRADIKEAFARLAYARETLALAEQRAGAGREQATLTLSLQQAGKVSQRDLIDAQQRAASAKAAETSARARAESAERSVFFVLGVKPSGKPGSVVCSTNSSLAIPDTEALLQLALTNSPAIRTARAQQLAAEAKERMAATARWPDLTIGAQYTLMTMDDGGYRNGGGVMASIDLPIFNRGQGDRLKARQGRLAAEAGREAAASETARQVVELVAEFKQKLADHTYLDWTATPLAQQKHALNEDACRKGRLSKRDNLKSLDEFLEIRGRRAEARLLLETAAAELERLTLVVEDHENQAKNP